MALYLKYLSINISIDTQILKTVVRVSWEKLVVTKWIKKVFEVIVAEYFRRRIITIECIFILRRCICQVPNGVAGFQNIQYPKDLLQSCDHSHKHIFREGFRISNISYLSVNLFLQWSLAELLLGLIWTKIHALYGHFIHHTLENSKMEYQTQLNLDNDLPELNFTPVWGGGSQVWEQVLMRILLLAPKDYNSSNTQSN